MFREKLEGVKKKTERREAAREKKALVAAHIEDVIEDELLKRLHQVRTIHLLLLLLLLRLLLLLMLLLLSC